MMLIFFGIFLGFVTSELVGPLTILEDGVAVTRYAVSTHSSTSSVDGSTLVLQHGAQVQISANASDSYYPYMFVEYKLSNKTVSFTADLSTISCSCNMAFYFVTMPAIGSNGQPIAGDSGDYYCGANGGNGEYCWELDIMEANKYVSASTPHTCNSPPGQATNSCDSGGCGTKTYEINSNGICPNNTCLINTQNPFNFSVHFSDSTMHVKMSQNENIFEFNVCNNSSYINKMNEALEYGMVLVLSYFGSDYNTMKWLDGKTGCTGDCDTSGKAIFSDIKFMSD